MSKIKEGFKFALGASLGIILFPFLLLLFLVSLAVAVKFLVFLIMVYALVLLFKFFMEKE